VSYHYNSEDSEETRQKKIQALIRDSSMPDDKVVFFQMLAASLVLPIIPLAFLVWMPLWSKWTLPGFLGVVVGWGGGLLVIILVS